MNNYSLFKVRGGWMLPSFYTILLLLCVTIVSAQNVPIRGTITDAQGVLPGVNVQIKNKAIGTVADANGNFDIQAVPEDTLIVSSMGYLTIEMPVGSQTTFNLTLVEDATALEEVTVNAGYYKVKDKESTGSIAKITAKDIENQPVSNVLATMQGRMAGVNITQETGLAGSGFAITIRGINSLRDNGNAPLYIIDGVPYSAEGVSDQIISAALPGNGNPLSNINPDNIASIDILKDADATAIYGSRGANGVVLVTTKRGHSGKTTFNFSSSTAIGKVPKMVKLMNTEQYLKLRNQAFVNDGVQPEYFDYDVSKWDPNRYTDWQKELIGGTAEINQYQVSASGGGKNTRFLISGNHHTETTVFPGDSKYKRSGASVSLDHHSDDEKFRLAFSAYFSAQRNKLPDSDLTYQSRTLAPNAPALYNESGELNWEDSTWENPLAQLEAVNLSAVNDLVANTVATWKIAKEFYFKTNMGFTDLHNNESMIYPSTRYNPAYNVGAEYSNAIFNTYTRQSWTLEPQLLYKLKNQKSAFEFLAGTTFQNQKSSKLTTRGIGYSSNNLLYDLTAANTVQIVNNEAVIYKYNAAFGRINYSFNDQYFFNATARRDGSSRFGPGKQFANFGAIGAAWIFQKQNEDHLLSFGKVRSSYGTTGNDQIGDYQFLDTYSSSGYNYQGVGTLLPSRLYNAEYGWETNKKFEVALETGFYKDRLFFTAAYYNNRSSSQLLGDPLSGTTGFNLIQANLNATVQNTGLEFTLRNTNFQTKDFEWNSSVNITLPKNKLVAFANLENSAYRNVFVIGQPATVKKLYHYLGIDPETGIYQFEDVNGDGQITSQDDRSALRDFTPDFYGGLLNQFRYKNVTVDFLFQFVKQLNYNLAASYGYTGFARNQPEEYTDSWSQAGDNTAYQIATTGYNFDAVTASERYSQSDAAVSDASYIRLKNLAISYALPQNTIRNGGVKISLQGQNLLTFTKYNGADPEFKEPGYLPPLRIISGAIQLTF